MKKLISTSLAILFLSVLCNSAYAVRVTVYGAGGASITYDGGKTTAKICPDKADTKCCELEITGNEIKIINSEYPVPEDLYEDGNEWRMVDIVWLSESTAEGVVAEKIGEP